MLDSLRGEAIRDRATDGMTQDSVVAAQRSEISFRVKGNRLKSSELFSTRLGLLASFWNENGITRNFSVRKHSKNHKPLARMRQEWLTDQTQ